MGSRRNKEILKKILPNRPDYKKTVCNWNFSGFTLIPSPVYCSAIVVQLVTKKIKEKIRTKFFICSSPF